MTDNKTIQEALAEVQRKTNEERAAKTKADWENIQEFAPGSSGSGAPPKPKEPFFKPGAAKNLAKGLATDIALPLAGGAAIGTAAGLGVKKLATGTEFGRDVGKWSGKVLKGLGGADKPVIQSMVRGREAVADKLGEIPLVGQSLKSGYQSMYKDSKFNTASNTPEQPKQDAPKQEAPKPAETPKPETPPAGSSAAKMSFSQAYAKAREAAKTAGKDPNIAQFKFDRGGGEKTYQAAATKQDYVPMSKQFKVDIGSTAAPIKHTLPDMNVGKSNPAETPKPQTSSAAEPKSVKPEYESGNIKKGKTKMSEEYIDEAGLIGPGGMRSTSGGTVTRTGGKNVQWANPGSINYGSDAAKQSQPKPTTAVPGHYAAPNRNKMSDVRGWADPGKIRYDLDAAKQSQPKPTAPVAGKSYTVGSHYKTELNPSQPGEQSTMKRVGVEKGWSDPGRWENEVRSKTGTAQQVRTTPDTPQRHMVDTATQQVGKPAGETSTSNFLKSQGVGVSTEDGGKKKKMSEDTNPLIASFLALQAKNPSNMFEAAKKAKKDYDKDGKVESPKDEVWGSRFRAAKAAGKMEEATLKDPKDPSVQGSGDITMEPAKPAAAPVHVKPTNPEKLKNLKDPRDPSVQGSGDVTYKEEVTFSQAEIDHLNSFFLEASVAPNRPEVATGADSTSDKMSQNDVTGTSTESGKRKVKEEVELEEGDLSVGGLYDRLVDHLNGENPSRQKAAAVEKAITKVHGEKVMGHLRKAVNANRAGNFDGEMVHIDNARTAAGKSDRIGSTVGSGRSEFRRTHEEVEIEEDLGSAAAIGAALAGTGIGTYLGNKLGNKIADLKKKKDKKPVKEETLEEGRPKKNPEPEVTERDPRKHIQVEAGRAAAGNVIDFTHNDGSKSKITPAMGRRITAHLNGLKPAERQSAVNAMHASAEGLKV